MSLQGHEQKVIMARSSAFVPSPMGTTILRGPCHSPLPGSAPLGTLIMHQGYQVWFRLLVSSGQGHPVTQGCLVLSRGGMEFG